MHRTIIERLTTAIRSSDVLGRREGDYLVLLSEVRGKQDLMAVLRRVQRSLAPPLPGGALLKVGAGGALAPGDAKDTEDLLRIAGDQAAQPMVITPEPPAPVTPPPSATAVEETLPAYLPISSALMGRLGHPATIPEPLPHLQRSGLKSKESLRWLLEAAAWRLVFDDPLPALEALTYLQRHPTGDPQGYLQALALQALVSERAGHLEDAVRLRSQLSSLPIRIPQSLLERNFRVRTPAAASVTRYTERDEAVGERHERLAALLYMAIVLQVAHEQQPQLVAYFEENLERLRALAGLLED
jgi:hypothetical protein